MPAKQSGKIIFQTLASWFFWNKTLYACKHGWRIAKHFPILSPFYNSSGPVGCSDPSSRALPVSQRRHAESIPALRATSFHTKFLCHMRHPWQAQSQAAKAKAQRTKKIHSQELRTGTVALTGLNELFEPKLRPWIDPHGLALTAMYVILALNCQDYNILSHPPHLPRH